MHAVATRHFRLAKGFGLDCTTDGVTLAGVPLLRRTVRGFVPRDDLEIRWLLESAYGQAVDADRVVKGLAIVARALNEREPARAMIGALLLELCELDWAGAARLAQADDTLAKFDPDEARDERGRWAANGNETASAHSPHGLPPKLSRPPLRLVSASSDDEPSHDAAHIEALQAAIDAEPWVHLPPGKRIDELGDLLEWVANARAEDAPVIRGEIRRLYYDAGDTQGGDALNRALSDALEATELSQRAEILERFEPYTREDPAQAAADATGLVGGILAPYGLLKPTKIVPEPPIPVPPGVRNLPPLEPSKFWDELTPIERGRLIHEARPTSLPFNFRVIDDLDGARAISTKTIDLRAPSYQSESRLFRKLNRYVDLLANFSEADLARAGIKDWPIRERELELVIPRNAWTGSQKSIISAATARALARGVKLRITPY